MKALEVHNLRKEFVRREGRSRKRVAALGGVSFDVERGECVAVLGPNGSGKSTLVRLLSTLLLPDGGSASVFGHDAVRDTRAVRRLVNRVSVEASFFKKMSAIENLSYAARFYGLRPAETRERIPQILDRTLATVTRPGLQGFWVHLDVDVLDDAIMPAVDYRHPGGLSWDEAAQLLQGLLSRPGALGLDVTIFNPNLDPDGSIARQLCELIARCVPPAG